MSTFCTINPDGTITIAPRTLTVNGTVYGHPSDAMYAAKGYLAIVHTPMPELPAGETGIYLFRYAADGSCHAVQTWFLADKPVMPAAPSATLAAWLTEVLEVQA